MHFDQQMPLRLLRLWAIASALSIACRPRSHAAPTREKSGEADATGPIELVLERALPIDVRDDFQPSGLALREGALLTVSDKHDAAVYEIVLGSTTAAVRPFVAFTAPALEPGPLDFEGIAIDAQGALLLASESHFRVLRVTIDGGGPKAAPSNSKGSSAWITPSLEALGHDAGLFQKWNANLEGIARLADGRWLLAAERDPRGLIELGPDGDTTHAAAWSLPTSIYPMPPGRAPDFSDLTVSDGNVYALERNSHLIVRLERHERGWQEREAWSYLRTETDPRFAYQNAVYGVGEGLSIDRNHVFVVTDNNRLARAQDPSDRRPVLFMFARPAR